MAHDDARDHTHLIDFPEALELFFTRLPELRAVLGPGAAPGLGEVERLLREALAARERADPAAVVARIGEAMDRLAALASDGDPGEGALMRAMAERFRQALTHGALGAARATAEVMRERSGSVVHPKKR